MNFTGTPSRAAIAAAMSGDTPVGSPDGARPVTSRKFPMLIAARRTPVGASSEMICGDGVTGMVEGPEWFDGLWRELSAKRRRADTRNRRSGAAPARGLGRRQPPKVY